MQQLALKVQNMDITESSLQQAGIMDCAGISMATDPDVMSIAAFVATSQTRKFRKAPGRSAPKLLIEGFLNKVRPPSTTYLGMSSFSLLTWAQQGGSVKTWKTRWFVLTDKEVSYFKSPSVRVC